MPQSHQTPSRKLRRAKRKLAEAELKLKRAERGVAQWRRKVADLTFEQKCVEQPPLWREDAIEPINNTLKSQQGDVPLCGATTL
jgi:hypothetical protein